MENWASPGFQWLLKWLSFISCCWFSGKGTTATDAAEDENKGLCCNKFILCVVLPQYGFLTNSLFFLLLCLFKCDNVMAKELYRWISIAELIHYSLTSFFAVGKIHGWCLGFISFGFAIDGPCRKWMIWRATHTRHEDRAKLYCR